MAPLVDADWFFFDLDGTLWDHARASAEVVSTFSPRLGAEPHALLEAFRAVSREVFLEFDAGRIDLETLRVARFERLLQRFGLTHRLAEAEPMSREFFDSYLAYPGIIPGAADVLRAAARLGRVGILTNAGRRTQDAKIAQFPVAPLIDWVLTTDETNCMKPAARFFDLAEELAGHPPPGRIVMVGDEWKSDIEPALARGWRPVWVCGDTEPPPGIDGVLRVRTIADLLPHLDGGNPR